MSFPFLLVILAAAGLFLSGMQAANAANKCTGKDGRVVYSDRDCASLRMEHTKTITADPVAAPGNESISQEANRIASRLSSATSPMPFSKHPGSPTIRFRYDRDGQPRAFRTSEVEDILRAAAAEWSSECNVNLEYAGEVEKGNRGDSVVKWNSDLQNATTKFTDHTGRRGTVLGVGRVGGDAAISTAISDASAFRQVAMHELGHVLGIGHNPEDPASIMFAVSMPKWQGQLSASDKISCNLAMRNRFKVPYVLPDGARELSKEEMAGAPRR